MDTTVCERRNDALGFYTFFLPIVRLHRRVICHMNGNFVDFQNMCDFKISDN